MARRYLSMILGKAVKKAAKLRGGGSALPGLVVEKIDPKFLSRTLQQLPLGVVIISGTNGKTTTTKIVVELLESAGLKVFTNKTGSNFSRGVAAALLDEIDIRGRIKSDIAVLELDEAWAARFVQQVKPRFSLLLNVLRDQLDRFGEIDATARLLDKIAQTTTDTVVFNRDDPRIFAISKAISAKAKFFGTTSELLQLMPTDESLRTKDTAANNTVKADVLLKKLVDNQAIFEIDDQEYQTSLSLTGVYNTFNAAAALSLVRQILKSAEVTADNDKIIDTLSKIKPAFGRGETITLDGQPIELVLVKNPSGFRLALVSFPQNNTPTMIAINDNYADGRDMSWLWDVDFDSLKSGGVAQISGIRAYDMALRLQYDQVSFDTVETNLSLALKKFLKRFPDQPKRIYCTYTAMTALRRELAKLTKIEGIS